MSDFCLCWKKFQKKFLKFSGFSFQNRLFRSDTKYDQLHKGLDWLSTTVGTQNGLVIPLSDSVEPGKINHNTLHQFYFIDTDITLIKNRLSVNIGPYYVNQALSTTTSYFGYETGIQAVLIPNKLRFNADYYSGNNGINSNDGESLFSIIPTGSCW